MVVRTDQSVTETWYHIDDSDPTNDDVVTRVANGNGVGFEPFTDANSNGDARTTEAFTDLNGNGTWDDNVPAWVKVSEVTPSAAISSAFPREWRFNYRNIPAGGRAGTIQVRLRELSSSPTFFTGATSTSATLSGISPR